jgi:pimeloyl-ACP methyl ester carboxylesterase
MLLAFRFRKHGRRVARITLLSYLVFFVVFVFCLLPIIAAGLITASGTRPQDRQLQIDPGDFGRPFENVEFRSRDDLRLEGWWLEGEAGYPAFLLTHGLFRDRKEVLERGCQLNALGHPVLLFDLRTHGTSERVKVSMGYHERLDVLGAYDVARRRGCSRIVPLGVSMGAVATLGAAVEMDPEGLVVIADSPFQSLEETVASHVKLFFGLPAFPFANFFIWNFSRINGFEKEKLDMVRTVQQLSQVPVLLIYGADDTRMPRSTALALFEPIPHPKKEIVFFENATHGDAWESAPERYIKTIRDFVARAAGELEQ